MVSSAPFETQITKNQCGKNHQDKGQSRKIKTSIAGDCKQNGSVASCIAVHRLSPALAGFFKSSRRCQSKLFSLALPVFAQMQPLILPSENACFKNWLRSTLKNCLLSPGKRRYGAFFHLSSLPFWQKAGLVGLPSSKHMFAVLVKTVFCPPEAAGKFFLEDCLCDDVP